MSSSVKINRQKENKPILISQIIDTPLCQMLSLSDHNHLYFLDFIKRKTQDSQFKEFSKNWSIQEGITDISETIRKELELYFSHNLKRFETPIYKEGTPFQTQVWEKLLEIPKGKTRSYAEIASSIQQPRAYRAVARANASNKFAIIIPCHRVIQSDGKIGGYGSGVSHKAWLLDHERAHYKK